MAASREDPHPGAERRSARSTNLRDLARRLSEAGVDQRAELLDEWMRVAYGLVRAGVTAAFKLDGSGDSRVQAGDIQNDFATARLGSPDFVRHVALSRHSATLVWWAARNFAIDHFRKRRRAAETVSLDDEAIAVEGESPSPTGTASEAARFNERSLDERVTLKLSFGFEPLTEEEALHLARKTGTSPERVRADVRKLLAPYATRLASLNRKLVDRYAELFALRARLETLLAVVEQLRDDDGATPEKLERLPQDPDDLRRLTPGQRRYCLDRLHAAVATKERRLAELSQAFSHSHLGLQPNREEIARILGEFDADASSDERNRAANRVWVRARRLRIKLRDGHE